MAQIWKLRTPDGDVVTPGDWTGAEPLYSVVEFASGALTVQTAFSYPINGPAVPGSIGPRKATELDTNLEGEGGRLPENEELICFNVAVELFGVAITANTDNIPQSDPPELSVQNLMRFQRDIVLDFRIASVNKRYITAPVSYFPASTGVKYYNSGSRTVLSTGASGYVSANNGSHNAHDVRELASPLRVKGGETFGIDFIPGPGQIEGLVIGSGRIRARTFLDGYRRRPAA